MKYPFLALFLSLCALPAHGDDSATFDRINKSGTLRCGYGLSYPNLLKDPNTGELSGTSKDVTEALAEQLNLKVEWTEETGFGTAETGIAAGRFDVMCSDVCTLPDRTRRAWFSRPYQIEPMYAFVRA